MIESLSLKNFQCHKSLKIDFDSHITVLTGRSDVGKSAVLRALRWICLNQPSGNEFVSHDEKSCRAVLQIDDQKILRRVGDENKYKLDDKTFKAFGRDVPADVVTLLNVTEDNFQSQLDPPFLFGLTPGQAAKELNKVVNLSVIDAILAYLSNENRRAKQKSEIVRERLKEAKKQRDELSWVPAQVTKLVALQARERKLQQKRAQLALIREASANSVKLAYRLETSVKTQARGLKMLASAERLLTKQQEKEQLVKLFANVAKAEESLCKVETKLKKAKKELDDAVTTTKICPLCQRPMR